MATILVVDDEPFIRELIVEVLREEGYASFAASNGMAALEMLNVVGADLVLTDTMMPRLGGVDLTRAIRSQPTLSALPVILMSAGGRPNLEGLGNCTYLPKPFDIASLLAAVVDAIAGAPSRQDE